MFVVKQISNRPFFYIMDRFNTVKVKSINFTKFPQTMRKNKTTLIVFIKIESTSDIYDGV